MKSIYTKPKDCDMFKVHVKAGGTMNNLIKNIQSLIRIPFILVFFILSIISDLTFPPYESHTATEESGLSTLPFSYIYYTLPNRTIDEEFGSNYFIKTNIVKPLLQRFYVNNAVYDPMPYILSRFLSYSFVIILISYIQGISVISIPLGGHAPPRL